MNSLARYSLLLSRATMVAMAICFAGYASVWLVPSWQEAFLASFLVRNGGMIASQNKIYSALVGAIGLTILSVALFRVAQFFNLYRSGHPFPANAGFTLRSAGQWFLALSLCGPLIRMASVLTLTLNSGEGQRHVVLSISSTDILLALLSGLLLMIGMILNEAHKVDQENRHFL